MWTNERKIYKTFFLKQVKMKKTRNTEINNIFKDKKIKI